MDGRPTRTGQRYGSHEERAIKQDERVGIINVKGSTAGQRSLNCLAIGTTDQNYQVDDRSLRETQIDERLVWDFK